MSFLDKLGGIAKNIGDKTGEILAVNKLNSKIHAEQQAAAEELRKIGEYYYSLFLSGSKSLLRLENPAAPEGKKLILFRDSFGSSLAPLLAEGYREILLVDIRYISPAVLGEMVSFEGQDVLFLYSENVLNNSETLK